MDAVDFLTNIIFWLDIIVYSDSVVLKRECINLLPHSIKMISNT